LMGWRCVYTPLARGYHVRNVLPGNRRALPPEINMHSVKNRFLMRVRNATGGLYRRYWLPMTLRDLIVIGGTLLAEPWSLAAFWHLAHCLPKALRDRRVIMSRRRIDDETLAAWFSFEPVAQAVGQPPELSPPVWPEGSPAPRYAAEPTA
jgi:hypothetical protein